MKILSENDTTINGTLVAMVPISIVFEADIEGNVVLRSPVKLGTGEVQMGGVAWRVEPDGLTLKGSVGAKGFGVMRALRLIENGDVEPRAVAAATPAPARARSKGKDLPPPGPPPADAQAQDPAPQVAGRGQSGPSAPDEPATETAPRISPAPQPAQPVPPDDALDFAMHNLGQEQDAPPHTPAPKAATAGPAVPPMKPPTKPATPTTATPPAPPAPTASPAPPAEAKPTGPSPTAVADFEKKTGLPGSLLTMTAAMDIVKVAAPIAYDALAAAASDAGDEAFFAVNVSEHAVALGDFLFPRLMTLAVFQAAPNPAAPAMKWAPKMVGTVAARYLTEYHETTRKARQAA